MVEQSLRKRQVAGSIPAPGTKVLTAHQPMFMPWLGLFAKITQADLFCIFDEVPFERHGFGNRNRIKTQHGVQWLTVPVLLDDHLGVPMHQIRIADGNWRRKHLRAIELAYAKAAHFEPVFNAIQAIYVQDHRTLAGLNEALLRFFLAALEIQVPMVRASDHGFMGAKSDLVLDMCRKLGATEFIFGQLGHDYADLRAFDSAGMKVRFQDYKHPAYGQLHGEFVPNLSVLDLLMNEGAKRAREILHG